MQMTVFARTVYGKTLLYPGCVASHAFAKAIGSKTLTMQQLQCAREMGFVVTLSADVTVAQMAHALQAQI